jgi:O-antigen/teichoic acid export membrane protein
MIGEALKDLLRFLPARVLPGLAAVAAVPVLTRLLAPAEYGLFTLSLNASNLFIALTSSWVTASAIRFIPAHEKNGTLRLGVGLMASLFLAVFAAAAVLGAVGGAVAASHGWVPGLFVTVTLLLCCAAAANDFLLGLLRSRRRAGEYTILSGRRVTSSGF